MAALLRPVDVAYLPENLDDRNDYQSPLISINQKLRRKNVVAAATVSGPDMSLVDSSDPWSAADLLGGGSGQDNDHFDDLFEIKKSNLQGFCSCPATKRSVSCNADKKRPETPTQTPPQKERSQSIIQEPSALLMCNSCGKRVIDASDMAWGRSSPHRTVSAAKAESDARVDPQHTKALLQSTPKLRYLSPSANEMSGNGRFPSTRNLLNFIKPPNSENDETSLSRNMNDYRKSLRRDRANKQAASELASLLFSLFHEMSLEDYGTVESEVFTSVFSLVHDTRKDHRMAGLAALDALIVVEAPSADEEKKGIKFANALSKGLQSAHGDFEFLSAVSKALGHMALRTANVDFVESEVQRALEWLRTERSDRRLAASLSLKELAIHAPTAFHSKTSQSTLGQGGSNEFIDNIFQAIRDPYPIVRACAADALSQCLKILVERRHPSLTGLLCQVHFSLTEGLEQDTLRKRPWAAIAQTDGIQHGSLLVVSCLIAYTGDFMLPRFDEVCTAVLAFTENPEPLIRLEVVRLIPRLARRCPGIFSRRYLDQGLDFLIESASTQTAPRVSVDIRPTAYTAIGQLILSMTDENSGLVTGGLRLPTVKIRNDPNMPDRGFTVKLSETGVIYDKLEEIFSLVRGGLQSGPDSVTLGPALKCAANLVQALNTMAVPYIPDLINDMFRAGLTHDLIGALHAIAQCVPEQQRLIENRLLQTTSIVLAGMSSAKDICDPLGSFRWPPGASSENKRTVPATRRGFAPANAATHNRRITINMSEQPQDVRALVLSLHTLGTFGDPMGRVITSGAIVPLLPFVRDVAIKYLVHPATEVRKAAALTSLALLIPEGCVHRTSFSGVVIEECLSELLRMAIIDPSGVVRLCVVKALDSRYNPYLCQAHHLQSLFLLLSDEALATRAAGVQLLGRLTLINPAPILPVLRKFLVNLIVELQCGVDTGRGREEATRILVVFLRAESLQRLVHPVLHSVVTALPLNGAAPRLASAALEALGELAKATGPDLKPWVREVVPHVLNTMQDQSSASKQRISLMTLGQIAGSTGYVIRPYLDYPELLSQATDVLPGTKRAPWSLRREVIRCLGVLGALDPDRYQVVESKTRKGGAVGGAYFEEQDELDLSGKEAFTDDSPEPTAAIISERGALSKEQDFNSLNKAFDNDDDLPAHLSMYEQYAMVVQPVSSLPPARRISPSDEMFYPTVAIQALMRIFRDTSLAVHHGMVIQAIMFIFKSMGLRCVPFLKKVVPHMIYSVRTCNVVNLRESLLQQLASLSEIVREHLRPFIADIFDVVEQFWSSRHLATIFLLVSKVAVAVPDEFRRFVPRLMRRLLTSLDELQVAEWSTAEINNTSLVGNMESEKLGLILRSINSLRTVLGGYLHMLVPALLKLSDSLTSLSAAVSSEVHQSAFIDLHVLSLRTTAALIECQDAADNTQQSAPLWETELRISTGSDCSLSARAVQPLVRLLRCRPPICRDVGLAAIETLCACSKSIGGTRWMQSYHRVVKVCITEWDKASAELSLHTLLIVNGAPAAPLSADDELAGLAYYNRAVVDLIHKPSHETLAYDPMTKTNSLLVLDARQLSFAEAPAVGGVVDGGIDFDQNAATVFQPSGQATRQRVNQGNLQRSWDITQIASRDDWDQWMRSLSIQLLKEAPSPALRATAQLAHAYQPLARELFSAAFACCWKELSEPYQQNLVHALETAFVADISPEILQALLNLAGFLERDSEGGLPIDITILADLALKCRAYAKALHYKEREYRMGGASSCVESLISINRKLDLQEAALGVLKAATLKLEAGSPGSVAIISSRNDLPMKLARHQAHEMFYSVIWSTDEVGVSRGAQIDLSEKQESWLAKLGSWAEALAVYEQKLRSNPRDFEAILGCMRCLDASGEWRGVLELAEKSWPALSSSSTASPVEHSPVLSAKPPSKAQISARSQKKALRLCAKAAWRLGHWDDLEKFADELNSSTGPAAGKATPVSTHGENSAPRVIDFDGSFFNAVILIHKKEWSLAAVAIDSARKAMDGRFTALMAESYNRAYLGMVTAQTLAEMEEIIDLQKLEESSKGGSHRHPANTPDISRARERLMTVWHERLAGCRADAEVHASIMAVRSLVLGPSDDYEAKLTLSDLLRQAERYKMAERVLLDPLLELGGDLDGPIFGLKLGDQVGLGLGNIAEDSGSNGRIINHLVAENAGAFLPNYGPTQEQLSNQLVSAAGGLERMRIQHCLYFAHLKHLWLCDHRAEALGRLRQLSGVVDLVSQCENVEDQSLREECWLTLGEWKIESKMAPNSTLPENVQVEALACFKRSVSMENAGYRAWHAWALLNFRLASQIGEKTDLGSTAPLKISREEVLMQRNHVIAAVKGFVTAINLGTKRHSASVQQDMLNLLSCLFRYGEYEGVAKVISHGVAAVPVEAWLGVLPQLLARIHIKTPAVRSVLLPLLTRLGERHPQALMYPLSVLLKSPVAERKSSAESLMNTLKSHSSELVEEALIVSNELIRVAILWLETWHEGLEDASRLYFGEGNVSGMLDLLLPLHERLERGPETRREIDFITSFGQDLAQAHSHIKDYIRLVNSGKDNDGPGASQSVYDPTGRLARQNEEAETAINKAWDIYYTVFRRINKQLPSLTKLDLDQCSPALSRAKNLELGVPGSYRVDGSYVKITSFNECVQVITSKQRPRKIILRGSDGKDYVFLLKGHEDLRQDERVMQLFGLVNALLVRDPRTKKHDLKIQRYPISCLSTNCGLVGWVPNTDTFHSLIRDYRQSKRIALNMENKEMLKITGDFDLCTVMQKVEIFTEALKRTTGKGNDIYEILWSKSTNSEEWLERRNKYTRSLAVMSMVGYILGLGDRHPSNLMLDKISGKLLHIDFGDCFEVAMSRDKYPERVPFRLTRMLVKAMEVSGIEGSYRSTCERTMTVLRGSRDSLVAMLEAFVYDPLISWRLVDLSPGKSEEELSNNITGLDATSSGLAHSNDGGVPIDLNKSGVGMINPITEGIDEEGEDDRNAFLADGGIGSAVLPQRRIFSRKEAGMSAARARSLQMYTNIQNMASALDTDNRIASIAAEKSDQSIAEGSIARSRVERSMRHRQVLSLLGGEDGAAHEVALNEKALKVIRRVQDKLTGTDFPDFDETSEPVDVPEQVQRLIVQATSSENLCQLFIGWCAFW